jgi:hypothetical protein
MYVTCLRLLERRASASQHNPCRFLRYVLKEQSHSTTSRCAGAVTSNRTRPQWQPPVRVRIIFRPDRLLVFVLLSGEITEQGHQAIRTAGHRHIRDVFAVHDEHGD